MKKFIFAFVAMFMAVVANAQSFQYHAGYDTKSEKGYHKFIADDYWTSADEKWNVFSWNSFDVNLDNATPGSTAATALLYVEYKLGETDFYLHPEVRFNTADANYYQIGFAYRLPLKNVSVYLTPKYSYHDKSDFQFSIPSDSLAREAMRWAGNGKRVILSYEEYKGTVMWRGNSRHVVTNIEPDSDLVKQNPYK